MPSSLTPHGESCHWKLSAKERPVLKHTQTGMILTRGPTKQPYGLKLNVFNACITTLRVQLGRQRTVLG